MPKRRVDTTIKLAVLTAVAASAQIAMAAIPQVAATGTNGTNSVADGMTIPVQPVMTNAVVSAAPTVTKPVSTAEASDPREIECIAKVIVHEAGNQPYRGQVAVAQVIRTRMRDGRFGSSPCGVVRQRGQFFDVDAYRPSQASERWSTAVRIATDVLRGAADDVVPGALFFHGAGATMPGRVRLAQVADHIFYR